jgi:Zinc finger, C2H2 type
MLQSFKNLISTGKCYTQKPELAKHIKFVHYNIREFSCECGASFGSKGHLTAHQVIHQDQAAKSAACHICSLAFHTRAKLERHMKTHTKERNYEVRFESYLKGTISNDLLFIVRNLQQKVPVQLQCHSAHQARPLPGKAKGKRANLRLLQQEIRKSLEAA